MAAALATSLRQIPDSPSTAANNIAARIDLICACPLFAGLPYNVCEELGRRARPRFFARDEMLYIQGSPVRNVALIRSGSVKITQLCPNGNEVLLWMYGVGNVIGALSESISREYTCSARAVDKSTALVWDYAAFQGLMQQCPQFSENASQILTSRLNELEERFREVATEKVARRVANALLRLLKHVGKKVPGGVEVSLSREELAQMTGTTLFTISRVLSRWGEMGFVRPKREAVVVCDAQRLALADDDFEKGTPVERPKRAAGSLRSQLVVKSSLSLVDNSSRLASEAHC